MAKFTLDGTEYDTDALSDTAKTAVASLQFIETQIQQKRNELAIADTARLAYSAALKKEIAKISE